jgi:hypothetical protein
MHRFNHGRSINFIERVPDITGCSYVMRSNTEVQLHARCRCLTSSWGAQTEIRWFSRLAKLLLELLGKVSHEHTAYANASSNWPHL